MFRILRLRRDISLERVCAAPHCRVLGKKRPTCPSTIGIERRASRMPDVAKSAPSWRGAWISGGPLMNAYLKKPVAVALTALALGLGAAAATTTPADAQGVWHHGYWGGGYYHNGWWGPAIGLGILGGVVAGAAIA